MPKKKNKIILAYSGGLDTSIILKWLIKEHKAEVIAYVADLGQNENIEEIREKAFKTGASKVFVEDLKEEFVKDFVYPAIKSSAIYEGSYLLGTSLARPLIAKRQIEIAEQEGASFISHGATGKGNDQVRFELTFYSLSPSIKVIAPWREWKFKSRNDLIKFARNNGIEVPVTKEKPYSCDRNLMHVSYEGGVLEDPWMEPSESMFEMTVSPEEAPNEPTFIEIEFKKGEPIKVNGKKLSPAKLLSRLNDVAGRNGIGRVDIVENRFVGMKSRGVYETPGGTLLHIAHRAVESLTMDREVMYLRDSLVPKIARLIYFGLWYTPEMDMLMAAVTNSQKDVEGVARLKLYKGNAAVVGRKSPKSLYLEDLATFEEDEIYDQSDATGFIKLNALRLKTKKYVQ